MRCIVKIYAKSYQEFNNEKDKNSIKELLVQLESGDSELKNIWRNIKNASVDNLKLVYQVIIFTL